MASGGQRGAGNPSRGGYPGGTPCPRSAGYFVCFTVNVFPAMVMVPVRLFLGPPYGPTE